MRLAAIVLSAALAASTAGCGGGGSGGLAATGGGVSGGGGGPSPPRPRVDNPASLYAGDSEYRNSWGLAAVNAAAAYGRIAARDGAGTAPGAGVRVAVIDDGIDSDHWEFASDRIAETGATDTDSEHGTTVASVIAARRDQSFPSHIPNDRQAELSRYDFHGVAWGIASLEMYAIQLGTGTANENYTALPVEDVDDRISRLAGRFSSLTTTADFVNMSFSVNGLIENYVGETFEPDYDAAIETLAQGPSDGRKILVIAAGNAHGHKCESPEPNCVGGRMNATSPELYSGLPVLEDSLRTHVVAAVATDRQGRIASFSNRCGIAAKWCIAAPGQGIRVATSRVDSGSGTVDRGYGTTSGTSFAAPFVTGGLAVMKHWFRSQLTNEALLARLYETARVTPDSVTPGGSCPEHLDLDGDPDDCELSSELGRGLMDLDAATAPAGGLSLALNGGPPAETSFVSTGSAVGDGMRLSLAGQDLALFDALGAPFWLDSRRFFRQQAPAGLATRVSRWLAGRDGVGGGAPASGNGGVALAEGAGPGGSRLRLGFGSPGPGHMGLAARPAAAEARFGNAVLSAFASTGSSGEAGARSTDGDAHGLSVAWLPADGQAALRAGWIGEPDSLFGSGAEGAFGRLSSNLRFVGASGAFDAGGWLVETEAEIGSAAPDAGGGLLRDRGGRVFSTAFSAAAARPLGAGTIRLSVQQPLRVESGRLNLSLPVGRTPEGAVLHKQVDLGLEPSGRQVDFGIDWTERLAPGAVWRIGAVLSREPGHEAGRAAEAILLAGLRASL